MILREGLCGAAGIAVASARGVCVLLVRRLSPDCGSPGARSAHGVSGRTWGRCARRVRPSGFFVRPGRTWYPMCAQENMGAQKVRWAPMVPPVCVHGNRVHERNTRARTTFVGAVSFGVRGVLRCADPAGVCWTFSGYCAVPNPLQKTPPHSTCTSPPVRTPMDTALTVGLRAYEFPSCTRFSCTHTGATMGAHLTFCAHMGYHVRPGRAKRSDGRTRRAHTPCAPRESMCGTGPCRRSLARSVRRIPTRHWSLPLL
jgi:hypothetical protein